MMSGSDKLEMARGSRGSQPVQCIHRTPESAPGWFDPILHFKGFGGGVPLNTERTTVKPWVGIAR